MTVIFEKMLVSRVGFIVKYDSANLFLLVHLYLLRKMRANGDIRCILYCMCKKWQARHFLAHAVKYASDRCKWSPFALIFLNSYMCANENRLAESYFTMNSALLININSNYQSCTFSLRVFTDTDPVCAESGV